MNNIKPHGVTKQHIQIQKIIDEINKVPKIENIKLHIDFIRYVIELVYNTVKKIKTDNSLLQLVLLVFSNLLGVEDADKQHIERIAKDIIDSNNFQKNSKCIKKIKDLLFSTEKKT